MVKYITILGYIILFCCVCLTGIVSYAFLKEIGDNDLDEAIIILLFLVPIYIVGHYTLMTLKGRNNLNLIDNKILNLIAYLNIGYFVFVLILPILFGYSYYEKIKGISELTTFNEVNLYGDKINVQAKYIDNNMKYKVQVTFSKPQRSNNKTFTILFKDKDNFEINKKEITEYTNISQDGNLKNGLTADVSEYISVDKYLLIKTIDVSVREK